MTERHAEKSRILIMSGAVVLSAIGWSNGATAQETTAQETSAQAASTPVASLQSGSRTAPPSSIDLSFNIGVASDYRFRGISLSDRDPALQGGVDISHDSGLFAGAWATTIAEYAGSDVELDLYAGYAGRTGGLEYSASAYYYVYPGGNDGNYLEFQGVVGKTIGPAHFEAVIAYTPNQAHADDNLYLGAGASIGVPNTPFTVNIRGGRENGGYDNKWDWETGISYSREWLTVSAAYVDTNYSGINEAGRNGRAGFVLSAIASF